MKRYILLALSCFVAFSVLAEEKSVITINTRNGGISVDGPAALIIGKDSTAYLYTDSTKFELKYADYKTFRAPEGLYDFDDEVNIKRDKYNNVDCWKYNTPPSKIVVTSQKKEYSDKHFISIDNKIINLRNINKKGEIKVNINKDTSTVKSLVMPYDSNKQSDTIHFTRPSQSYCSGIYKVISTRNDSLITASEVEDAALREKTKGTIVFNRPDTKEDTEYKLKFHQLGPDAKWQDLEFSFVVKGSDSVLSKWEKLPVLVRILIWVIGGLLLFVSAFALFILIRRNKNKKLNPKDVSAEPAIDSVNDSNPEPQNAEAERIVEEEKIVERIVEVEKKVQVEREVVVEKIVKVVDTDFYVAVMKALNWDEAKIKHATKEGMSEEDQQKVKDDVIRQINRGDQLEEYVKECFDAEYERLQGSQKPSKLDFYKATIDALIADSHLMTFICEKVASPKNSLVLRLEVLLDCEKKVIELKGKLEELQRSYLELELQYNEEKSKNEKALEIITKLEKNIEEMNGKIQALEELAKVNREYYHEKVNASVDRIDKMLASIVGEVRENSPCAPIVGSLYDSTNGFIAFRNALEQIDWDVDGRVDSGGLRLVEKMETDLQYAKSWINGIARFHAYLQAPEIEAELSVHRVYKVHFDALYTEVLKLAMLCGYAEFIVPALFVDVFDEKIYSYQNKNKVLPAVYPSYESLRKNSEIYDFSQIGYRKTDGTIINPIVVF